MVKGGLGAGEAQCGGHTGLGDTKGFPGEGPLEPSPKGTGGTRRVWHGQPGMESCGQGPGCGGTHRPGLVTEGLYAR